MQILLKIINNMEARSNSKEKKGKRLDDYLTSKQKYYVAHEADKVEWIYDHKCQLLSDIEFTKSNFGLHLVNLVTAVWG